MTAAATEAAPARNVDAEMEYSGPIVRYLQSCHALWFDPSERQIANYIGIDRHVVRLVIGRLVKRRRLKLRSAGNARKPAQYEVLVPIAPTPRERERMNAHYGRTP